MTTIRTAGAVLATAGLVAATLVTGGLSASAAAPSNDNFSGAFVKSGVSWGQSFTNTEATVQSGEKVFFDELHNTRFFNTVWVKWKAPATGAVTITTKLSALDDTALAVYTGSTITSAKRIAVNDDDGFANHYSTITSLAVKSGTTYYIQTGSVGISAPASTGTIFIGLSGRFNSPTGDNKGSAIRKSGPVWTSNATTVGSTIEPVFEPTANPAHSSNPRLDSVWWKWTAPATGTATINAKPTGTEGVSLYVALFEQDSANGFLAVPGAFSNDAVNGKTSIVGQTVYAGFTYFIQVGSTNSIQDKVAVDFHATYTGPVISSVAASSGKLQGGNRVTITGTRLSGVTSVEFGGVAGTGLIVTSSKKISVLVPASLTKHRVAVRVLGSTSSSAVNTASHYTYK
ncbi:MAG: hypothetical protein QOI02_187 [Actinomycetota bacterium]|jgi:hypothetical protein|nr:hypothetical protein [Glaciihabitans sp.]MDQ1555185.1 hypothetical protein [Actinomycetota bacterium]